VLRLAGPLIDCYRRFPDGRLPIVVSRA